MTDTAATTTINEYCWAGLKILKEHNLLNCNVENDNRLTSAWPEKVEFDAEGYVTLLDLGGKRLYKGFPCDVNVFQQFSRLSTLNIGGTDIPLKDLLAILAHVADTVQTLYIGGNGLGPDGAKAVATTWLPKASKLVKLDLRYNDIGGKGMEALCQGLQSSPTCIVEYLYVEGNQIGDEGAAALSELLKKDGITLREVYLGANQVRSRGAEQVASSLHTNKKVSKIYLEGNDIGIAGANAFSSVLEELDGNTALKNLYVDNNNIGKAGSNRLAKALQSENIIGDLEG